MPETNGGGHPVAEMTAARAETTVTDTTATMVAVAMAYATTLSWPVFPCRPRGKEPLTGRGFHDATTDVEQIAAWWHRWPDANIGTPTGLAFDVLDVDVRADSTGWDALHRVNRAGLLAGTFGIASTRNGGAHFYFPPADARCSSVKGQRLDYKAAGGYVLLPPSRVPADPGIDGPGLYTWDDLDLSKATAAPLDWPAVVQLLTPPSTAPVNRPTRRPSRAGMTALVDWLRGQGEGNRNRALFWAASKAVSEGHDPAALVDVGLALGLPRAEVDRTIESARRRAGAR